MGSYYKNTHKRTFEFTEKATSLMSPFIYLSLFGSSPLFVEGTARVSLTLLARPPVSSFAAICTCVCMYLALFDLSLIVSDPFSWLLRTIMRSKRP